MPVGRKFAAIFTRMPFLDNHRVRGITVDDVGSG
jgi:hypothetical protein